MSVSRGTEDFLRTGEPEAPILLLRWKSMTDFIHPLDSMLVLQKLLVHRDLPNSYFVFMCKFSGGKDFCFVHFYSPSS